MKDQKFQKLASNKIRLSVNFENPTFFDKIAIFLFLFLQCLHQKMFTIEEENGRCYPSFSVYIILLFRFENTPI